MNEEWHLWWLHRIEFITNGIDLSTLVILPIFCKLNEFNGNDSKV